MADTGYINIVLESDFKKLFDQYYAALCLFAENWLNNSEEAADTAQEAFIKLWERRRDFDNIYAIKSFLYTTIRNASLNRLAHKKVAQKHREWFAARHEESFFRDHLIEQECFKMLWEAVKALPQQTRKVMLLALTGSDNQDIATSLGMAKGTVHTHKKTAYKRLRNSLKEIYPFFLVWLTYPIWALFLF
ncbi:MAG: RNA polymerase sigma-70 factor [Bacteroidales bacterium]|nr:RNA polymerase sigma-70 factor [Bacteroidales bacterium]